MQGKKKSVVIIGGGIAGLEAAAGLSRLGADVILIEKEKEFGGHLTKWHRLFPDHRLGAEILASLKEKVPQAVTLMPGTVITRIKKDDRNFFVILENGESLSCDALLFATGYELFNAARKEEYGYGIYDNVITSADLEGIFRSGTGLKTSRGAIPGRVGIVHCVGSRDEKAGNLYCSKVCCITGVKQAMEIREMHPATEVWSFYMDMRMYDRHFEELYYEAQQKWGIRFLRGRLSEACENPDQSLMVKVEDTLTGRPLKMNVDLLVLLAGFMPSQGGISLATSLGARKGDDGFLLPPDHHLGANESGVAGLFFAGTVKGPATVENTLTDARAAALKVWEYLQLMS
jgi:heterodisulfide reductase subunit A2